MIKIDLIDICIKAAAADNYDDVREALKDYEDLIKAKVSLNL